MKKDNIIFALYIGVAVVTIVHTSVEVHETFMRNRAIRRSDKEANKED